MTKRITVEVHTDHPHGMVKPIIATDRKRSRHTSKGGVGGHFIFPPAHRIGLTYRRCATRNIANDPNLSKQIYRNNQIYRPCETTIATNRVLLNSKGGVNDAPPHKKSENITTAYERVY